MHCSTTFGKGISGGPCFIFDTSKNAPVVVAMVQKGIPWSYYNAFSDPQKVESRKHPLYFLERGVTSAHLKQLLRESCPDLCDNIFSQELTASTVVAGNIVIPFYV